MVNDLLSTYLSVISVIVHLSADKPVTLFTRLHWETCLSVDCLTPPRDLCLANRFQSKICERLICVCKPSKCSYIHECLSVHILQNSCSKEFHSSHVTPKSIEV